MGKITEKNKEIERLKEEMSSLNSQLKKQKI